MKEKKSKRIIFVVILLGIGLLGSVLFVKKTDSIAKEKTYRNIRIYEFEGTVKVEREETGKLQVYNGMKLQSEDVLITEAESYVYLKLDDDKYALLEPESKIRLVASGNKKNSKTSIYLEEGSIINRLDEDLSEDSIYEINTPNSTMAVRGTNFRIKVVSDENGEIYTYIDVYEGTVSCRLVYPDGTIEEEEVFATAGREVQIYGDAQDSEYLVIDGKADYEALSVEALEFLNEVIEHGVTLSISQEELERLIEEKRTAADETTNENQQDKKTEENIENQTQKQNQNVEDSVLIINGENEKQPIVEGEKTPIPGEEGDSKVDEPTTEDKDTTEEKPEEPREEGDTKVDEPETEDKDTTGEESGEPGEEGDSKVDEPETEDKDTTEEEPEESGEEGDTKVDEPETENKDTTEEEPEESGEEGDTKVDEPETEDKDTTEEEPEEPEEEITESKCEKSEDGKHVWESDGYDPEPSCEDSGTQWYTCENCGERKSEEVAPLGHQWNDDGQCTRCEVPDAALEDGVY